MPADIIVRIGAAQDRSVDVVFADIEKRTRRSFGVTRNELAKTEQVTRAHNGRRLSEEEKTAKQLERLAKRNADIQLRIERDVYRENSKLERVSLQEKIRSEREANRLAMRLSRERTRDRLSALREEERAEKAHQGRLLSMQQRSAREANRIQRSAERDKIREAYKQEREIDRFATRTSHRATRFFFPRPEGALGYSKRIANDLVRGAGIDFSLSGGVSRAREREDAGMGLAQQERIATGKSRGGAAWATKSLDVGTSLQIDPEKVTEMMREFTGKTGEFAEAAKYAEQLASMTQASGANMGEMGSAAGFVYNQLKGMPDAAERTLDVMRGIVGQTAVGAVEMEEYAKQMGRIAANAKMFQGDVSKNILELSALTQLSIAEGGATSGADAARSIAAFANTTSKGQRIKAFSKFGVDLFNKEGTQKRPILDIIKDSLIASKGNIPAMTQMWADTLGQKPIRGITNAFNEAGGGEKGWQAALAKVAPFMSAQLSKETEKQNIADYQATTTAKAIKFQNQLDLVSSSLANKLLPTLEQLAPKVLQMANYFGNAIAWAAENPWKAVMALLGASVARAATESLGRLVLERGIMGVVGGTTAGGGATGSMGALGALAASGTAGSVAAGTVAAAGLVAAFAAGFTVTTAVINAAEAKINTAAKARAESSNDTFFEFEKQYANARTDSERADIVKRHKFNLEQANGGTASDEYKRTVSAMDQVALDIDKKRTVKEGLVDPLQNQRQQSVNNAELAAVIARELTGTLSKGLNVRVTNTDDFKLFSELPAPGGGFGPPTFGQ